MAQHIRYVCLTGGVISGVGKGTIASSMASVLQHCYHIPTTLIKLDPYLNEDAGLMNPNEHGEVFVLEDGSEVDLDLGTYERALDRHLCCHNNITTGKVMRAVLNNERQGVYLGNTVQFQPHLTDQIQFLIRKRACADLGTKGGVCIVELGGTIGDRESPIYVEALRRLRSETGRNNVCMIHVALLPHVDTTKELKTKPLQHSIRALRQDGLSPDILICRAQHEVNQKTYDKIATGCALALNRIFALVNVKNLYRVPLMLYAQNNVVQVVLQHFNLKLKPDLKQIAMLKQRVQCFDRFKQENRDTFVRLYLIGKYRHIDAYLSIKKALEHVMLALNVSIQLTYCNVLNEKHVQQWEQARASDRIDGYIFGGGFGSRGADTILRILTYARTSRKPTVGICYGMQLMVIEALRQCAGLPQATSEEFKCADKRHHVIVDMPEYRQDGKLGGTMRLGVRTSVFETDALAWSRAYQAYHTAKQCHAQTVRERHRHRFEIAPTIVETLQLKTALRVVARGQGNKNQQRCEIIEHQHHPYYVGTQFHPEYTSRLSRPAPLFVGLVQRIIHC